MTHCVSLSLSLSLSLSGRRRADKEQGAKPTRHKSSEKTDEANTAKFRSLSFQLWIVATLTEIQQRENTTRHILTRATSATRERLFRSL